MTMQRYRAVLAAGALSAGLVGCVDFTGPGLDKSPNNPTTTSRYQLFPAVQAFQQAFILGEGSRYQTVWMQQMMGVARQWQSISLYDPGSVNENLVDWSNWYTGGGLIDLRKIEKESKLAGDSVFLGIARVYEAMIMDAATDAWGDIPYSKAISDTLATLNTSPAPTLDTQASVYAALQTLLSQGITALTSGAGGGPGAKDLVYGGDATLWIPMAWTLKARIALHQRDYINAAAFAANGISSKNGDYNSYQSGSIGEENQWFQFKRNRGTDISAGDTLVKMMQARNDPRLGQYFAQNGGVYKGAAMGDDDDGTQSWLSAIRGAPGFSQPMVTYDENQLIKAEALSLNGNDVAAAAALQAYKTANGVTFAIVGPATGANLQREILDEKYIALFQHVEIYSDYRRTCTPNLRVTSFAAAPKMPARLFYPLSERQTNSNVKSPSQQPLRNPVDATVPTPYSGGTCLGQ